MSNEKLRELLATIQDELQSTDVDDHTRSLVRKLDTDIHDLLESDPGAAQGSLVEQAKALETKFAADHPVAERIMRELIDTLVRLGI